MRRRGIVHFRESETADIPAMACIRAREWGDAEYWVQRIGGYLAGDHNPKLALAPRACFVASDGTSVVGFAAGHLSRRYACDGELEWINVVPERRGTGVADELFRMMAGWFIGHRALRVCVDVDPSNSTARTFYARMGAETLNEHWMVWNPIRVLPP